MSKYIKLFFLVLRSDIFFVTFSMAIFMWTFVCSFDVILYIDRCNIVGRENEGSEDDVIFLQYVMYDYITKCLISIINHLRILNFKLLFCVKFEILQMRSLNYIHRNK